VPTGAARRRRVESQWASDHVIIRAVQFSWRSDVVPLSSYAEWIDNVDGKNRKPGTSAPTVAAAWSGPLDLLAALATHANLAKLTVQHATVEARTSFDAYRGNVRNHDLVLRAATEDGEPVVVCVEAKAGEPLGATVAEQERAAAKAKRANPDSQASARLTDLVARLCRYPIADPRVAALRYQLLTAWAGTLADAAGAAHAVFAVHEFRTDQRPDDKSMLIGAELANFADVVLGSDVPAPEALPWCVRVPGVLGIPATLYVAHLVTDFRAETVARPSP
jgi:uncharacterized protein DUF6946